MKFYKAFYIQGCNPLLFWFLGIVTQFSFFPHEKQISPSLLEEGPCCSHPCFLPFLCCLVWALGPGWGGLAFSSTLSSKITVFISPTAWWPRCGPQGKGARERVWPAGIPLKYRAVMQPGLFGSFPPALATPPPNMIITAQSYKVAFHSTYCPAP